MPSGTRAYDLKLWMFLFLPVWIVIVFVSCSVIYEIVKELYNWTRKEEIDEDEIPF
jgi:hypothetical protein